MTISARHFQSVCSHLLGKAPIIQVGERIIPTDWQRLLISSETTLARGLYSK